MKLYVFNTCNGDYTKDASEKEAEDFIEAQFYEGYTPDDILVIKGVEMEYIPPKESATFKVKE